MLKKMALCIALLVPLFCYIGVYGYWEAHDMYRLEGDEPDYLIISHSILTDGDLSVSNNYREAGADFEVPDEPAYSIHSIGLPIILVPFY
ncbi:MAG: hypothetical protein ABEJ65_09340, partial [bacterium]